MKSGTAFVSTHAAALAVLLGVLATHPLAARSQAALKDPSLSVAPVVAGLSQPIALAFIGPNDLLVTEKASGQVKRVTNDIMSGVVLDLAVNSSSERGLLGIALHPAFPTQPFVYLYNTESSTGADSTVAAEVPLLGNRLYRFRLNPERTKFVFNDARLRDKVADNTATDDLTESDELVFGTGFGIVTDIQTGPDGNMYLVSPSDGSIRKITRP